MKNDTNCEKCEPKNKFAGFFCRVYCVLIEIDSIWHSGQNDVDQGMRFFLGV